MTSACASGLPIIAYVAGYGRSGSTWLTRLLGQADDVAAAGELWSSREWLDSTRPCACGAPLVDCPFWSAARRDVPAALSGDRRWQSLIESPLVLLFGFRWIPSVERERYRDREAALASGIAAAAGGARVVVDSSKTSRRTAGRAAALRELAGLDVRIIHLVRDPQAVRASLALGTNKELEGRASPRRWFRRTRAFLGWASANEFALWLARRSPGGAIRIDFEVLCIEPIRALGALASALGITLAPVQAILEGAPCARAEHVAEGNRMRLEPLSVLRHVPVASSAGDRLLGFLTCGITSWRLGLRGQVPPGASHG